MRGPVFLLAVLLVAGCAAPREGPAKAIEAREGDAAPDVRATTPSPALDTLHFRERPTLSSAPPDAVDPLRVPVGSVTDLYLATVVGVPRPPQAWTFHWPGGAVGGNGTLWVDVQGPVAQHPRGCFWELVFDFAEAPGVQGFRACAGDEPAPVPEGPRRLEFAFGNGTAYPAGDVHLQVVGGAGPTMPGTQVVLLANSRDADSRLTFHGVSFA